MAGQASGEKTLIYGEGRVYPVGSIHYNQAGQAMDWWPTPGTHRELTLYGGIMTPPCFQRLCSPAKPLSAWGHSQGGYGGRKG